MDLLRWRSIAGDLGSGDGGIMGKNSNISWTDHTWNPWQGCKKVSAGCKNCYMFRDKARYGQDPEIVIRSKPATFNKPMTWKDPAMVFVCSWSDFFIEEADAWRDVAWEIIRSSPQLIFQILTKRPERIIEHLPFCWGDGYPNVWMGVTAENQEMADLRIPLLLEVPAAVRFVSAEPLLGPINFWKFATREETFGSMYDHRGTYPFYQVIGMHGSVKYHEGIDWIIVGGESGSSCRDMNPEWARSIKTQCVDEAGVPFFMKQMSGNTKAEREAIPEDLIIREFPA